MGSDPTGSAEKSGKLCPESTRFIAYIVKPGRGAENLPAPAILHSARVVAARLRNPHGPGGDRNETGIRLGCCCRGYTCRRRRPLHSAWRRETRLRSEAPRQNSRPVSPESAESAKPPGRGSLCRAGRAPPDLSSQSRGGVHRRALLLPRLSPDRNGPRRRE